MHVSGLNVSEMV